HRIGVEEVRATRLRPDWKTGLRAKSAARKLASRPKIDSSLCAGWQAFLLLARVFELSRRSIAVELDWRRGAFLYWHGRPGYTYPRDALMNNANLFCCALG